MKRQIATVDQQGRTVLVYLDKGASSAVPGHGRPLGYAPGGGRQLRLGTGGAA